MAQPAPQKPAVAAPRTKKPDDPALGKVIAGRYRLEARVGEGGDFTTSPWGYNGKVFCMNEDGQTFVILAGDKYELLDTNDLGEMALATPALIGDRLILRTAKHLFSIRNAPGGKQR